jgi:hypothetical protein
MAEIEDLDEVAERCQLALGNFVKGNPEPMKMMFSRREVVPLANRFGPPGRGSVLARSWSVPHRIL